MELNQGPKTPRDTVAGTVESTVAGTVEATVAEKKMEQKRGTSSATRTVAVTKMTSKLIPGRATATDPINKSTSAPREISIPKEDEGKKKDKAVVQYTTQGPEEKIQEGDEEDEEYFEEAMEEAEEEAAMEGEDEAEEEFNDDYIDPVSPKTGPTKGGTQVNEMNKMVTPNTNSEDKEPLLDEDSVQGAAGNRKKKNSQKKLNFIKMNEELMQQRKNRKPRAKTLIKKLEAEKIKEKPLDTKIITQIQKALGIDPSSTMALQETETNLTHNTPHKSTKGTRKNIKITTKLQKFITLSKKKKLHKKLIERANKTMSSSLHNSYIVDQGNTMTFHDVKEGGEEERENAEDMVEEGITEDGENEKEFDDYMDEVDYDEESHECENTV